MWALGVGGLDYPGATRGAVDRYVHDEETLQEWVDGACEDVREDVVLCRALLTLSPSEMAVWLIAQPDVSWWSLSVASGFAEWLPWAVASLAGASAWPEALA